MTRPASRLALALVVALLATSSLVMPVTAAPHGQPGTLLQTKDERKADAETAKEQKKQEADDAKADAKAAKELKKCTAKGTLPCNRTVTLTRFSDECYVVVTVSGFAPGTYLGTVSHGSWEFEIVVEEDGTGIRSSQGEVSSFSIATYAATVDGVRSNIVGISC